MNRKVLKERLEVFDNKQPLSLHAMASAVAVNIQDGKPTIWFDSLVDNPQVIRWFLVRGTGHSVPVTAKFVGTVFDGMFVWHIFEVDNGTEV